MFDLGGRVALVTGAGQGIGAGIVRSLSAGGAAVGVNDVVAERAGEVAAAIEAEGGRAVAIPFDVADYEAVLRGVERLERQLGPPGILINNAGVPAGMKVQRFRESDPGDWRKYVDVNLYGVMNCCRAVINGMCERGWGRIITISSGAGAVGLDIGVSPYAAGKGGGIGFMRHLALENARSGVTANTIAVGIVANRAADAVSGAIARQVPVGRAGSPEDIGSFCVYLASEEASWMTGQTLHLNGGSVTT